MTLDDANDEAVRRIHAAKVCGQWWLDLGDLPIERVPDEIAELSEQLTVLALGSRRLVVTGETWEWGQNHHDRLSTIRDLEPLRGLTALTTIDLFGCGHLTLLWLLRGHANLTKLDLIGCDQLTTVNVSELPALDTLRLFSCRALKTVDLSELPALTKLELSVCDQLTTVASRRTTAGWITGSITSVRKLGAMAWRRVRCCSSRVGATSRCRKCPLPRPMPRRSRT